MVGSLKDMEVPWHPSTMAWLTNFSGLRKLASVGSGGLLLISKFWHQRHVKLQPHVPTVSALLPGQKWKKGFFSMGLLWIKEMSP
jgi:hypothetical protein